MTLAEERPSDEVLPGTAFEDMAGRMERMTAKPRVKHGLRFIRAERLGRWVVIRVGLKDKPEIAFRVSVAWAVALRNELMRALPPDVPVEAKPGWDEMNRNATLVKCSRCPKSWWMTHPNSVCVECRR